MIRNLKVLGLAVAAVFAMSAVASSAASAEVLFHGAESGLTVEGSQLTTNKFVTDSGEVTCSGASYKSNATTSTTQTTLQVTPTYTGCHTIFIFTFNATVDMNGCTYTLTSHGASIIDCPAGKVIEVTVPSIGCTATVPAQTPGGSVDYANENSPPMSVNVTATVSGITYEEHGCPGSETELTHNGTYTGSVTVSGFNASKVQKDITVE